MKKLLPLLLISIFLFSCKKKNDVTVQFVFKSSHKTPNNRAYKLDIAQTKILFSNFKYIDKYNNEIPIKDLFLLTTSTTSFEFKFPQGEFSKFAFDFGLDKNKNNSIPSSFPASHPLSVETALYWDMLKYRFLVIEGNIDSSPLKNQAPSAAFSMHLGSDTLHHEIITTKLPKSGEQLNITIDLDKLFILDNDVFKISNFSNHSESSEIPNAISIKNSFVSGIQTNITPIN